MQKEKRWHALANTSVFGLLLTLWTSVTLPAAIPPQNGSPEVKVIDMHTHVFNSRDLPLMGILNALGAPPEVALVVSQAIFISTPEDQRDPIKREVSAEQVERPNLTELSDIQRNILLDYVGKNRLEPLRRAAAYLRVKPDVTLLAETSAKIGFPPDDRLVRLFVIQKLIDAGELGEALKGYVRFLGIMTRQHGEIVAILKASYPQTDLFVHHMMDMAAAYNDEPPVDFYDQMIAMQELDRAFPGKLVHFTAFDPFRRRDALPLVQKGIKDCSAIGLKIYPPSGYRAAQNAIYNFPPKPSILNVFEWRRWRSRYAHWTEKNLDETLQAGFAWAAANSIPLFTHCTPKGFEAVGAHGNLPGYGMMADPFFWASALKANAGLRMCFGHSGGEAYWFSDPANDAANEKNKTPGDPWQFGNQVIDLCCTYPEVYCEVGYLDGVLDPRQATLLVRRLEAVVNRPSKDGKWRFGDKLMYGTDWHMIYKEPHYEKYLEKWDEVIKQVDNGSLRQAFFAGNAKKFLRVDDLGKNSHFTQEQRNEFAVLSAGIK
jgi:hypothetical protein